MMKKKRDCKSCGVRLSAYNDDPICYSCSVNPKEVAKALKELRDIVDGKLEQD
jgi:hypothetical protein